MITPAYPLTATERVLPRLALDFTSASLDARVTLTRALNTATVVNSSGFVSVVNANLPRFDYDPSTLICKGLLIEESRINYVTNSETFTSWVKGDAAFGVTAASGTSPSGTNTATQLKTTNSTTNQGVYQGNVRVIGCTHTVYAKAGTANYVGITNNSTGNDYAVFNLSNGTVASFSGCVASIQSAGNGWYRCVIANTSTAGNYAILTVNETVPAGNPWTAAAGTGKTAFVWGYQLEIGAFATSYIPTTTTSLTRNADVVSMTGTNFSDWYNASEGAFVFWGDQNAVSAETGYFAEARTDNSNRIQMFANNGGGQNQLTVRNGGSIQADFTNSGTVTQGTAFKTSFAYKLDSFALARDGGTVATDTLGTIPSVTDLLIGHSGAASNLQLNGHIAKILYYPQRIINAEVQAFSK